MDNKIIDNFYLQYELFEHGQWFRHVTFARSYEHHGNTLHIVTATGKDITRTPVMNVSVEDLRK